MLTIRLKKRNIPEEEEYQSNMIEKRHEKPSRCELRAKVMTGRRVRIKCGDTVDVKHRCSQSALGYDVQQSGMVKKLCTPC